MFKRISYVFVFIECIVNGLEIDLLKTANQPLRRHSRQIDKSACPISTIENGRVFYKNQQHISIESDTFVPTLSIIDFSCAKYYFLSPPADSHVVVCTNGTWSGPIPKCVQKCRPRYSNEINFKCTFFGKEIKCTEAIEDTKMLMTCKNNFSPYLEAFCKNGYWSKPMISCVVDIECGKRKVQPTFIIKGLNAKKGEFPWHVAMYIKQHETGNTFQYICGGSIVHKQLVLTAAHCITNEESGKLNNIANYYIAAGKYYSDYDSPEDDYAQKRHLIGAKVPATYKAKRNNFNNDIAMLIVNEPFELTDYVQLVCIDWSQHLERSIFEKDTLGYITGWGINEVGGDKSAATLNSLSVPAIPYDRCLNDKYLPRNTFKFVAFDKFCAGHTNGSSACSGDSGGGIVFPRIEKDGATYFFIKGLVSIGALHPNGTCDRRKYTTYTNITYHLEFIKDVTANSTAPNKQNIISCPMPKIENGIAIANLDYIPTDIAPVNTTLHFECDDDYILTPSFHNWRITCTENQTWNHEIPKCPLRLDCIPPTLLRGKFQMHDPNTDTYINVKYFDAELIPLNTVLQIDCDFDHDALPSNESITCIEGKWQPEVPKCIPKKACVIPKIANAKYEVFDKDIIDNTFVEQFGNLHITCINDNFLLSQTYSTVTCVRGEFNKEVPTCTQTCVPQFPTLVDVSCELDEIEQDCTQRVPEGTIATMKCKPYYEKLYGYSTITCSNGTWNHGPLKCTPECGQVIPDSNTKGAKKKQIHFPWHVGIYRKTPPQPTPLYICAGSIVSEKFVMSAARCFLDPNANLYPISELYVAAGKYYSNWDAAQDAAYVQKRKVANIDIQRQEKKDLLLNVYGDIAAIIVNKAFVLTSVVRPVCIDWYADLVTEHNRSGQVVGWRTLPSGVAGNPIMERYTVPQVSCYGSPLDNSPAPFLSILAKDKFCTGFTNGSICIGDKGGNGLVFEHEEIETKKSYYLYGIASVGPEMLDGECQSSQFTIYTNISKYIDFIRKHKDANKLF